MSTSINPLPGKADNPYVLTAEAKKDMLLTSVEEWRWILVGLLSQINYASGGGGEQRTTAISTHTGNGTVAAGAKYVSFIFSDDFAGTIAGATFSGADGDAFYDLPLLGGADTHAAVTYTISAGSARITRIA